MADHCGEEDEGERGDECAAGCRERSEGVYDACIEGGGDVEGCRQRAGRWVRECMADHCGEEDEGERGDDDDEDCYDDCLENGGDERRCRERCADRGDGGGRR